MSLLDRALRLAHTDLTHLTNACRDTWAQGLGHNPPTATTDNRPPGGGDPAYATPPSYGTRSALDVAYHRALQRLADANLDAGRLDDQIVPAHWLPRPIIHTEDRVRHEGYIETCGIKQGIGPVVTYTDTRIVRTVPLDEALVGIRITELVLANINRHQDLLTAATISDAIHAAEGVTDALMLMPRDLVPKLCPDCHAAIRPKDGRCWRCRNNRLAAQLFQPARSSA